MLAALITLLLLSLPLQAARNYRQTDTTATQCDQTEAIACSSYTSAESESVGRLADETGTAGTSETSITMADGAGNQVCYWYESDSVNDTNWASGTWTVRLNVTTADTQTWSVTEICRVNSDCSSVLATVGSSTPANDLSTTGVKTDNVTGSAQASAGATDLWLVVIGCQENQPHGNSTVGITPDQLIDTPLDSITTINMHRRRVQVVN